MSLQIPAKQLLERPSFMSRIGPWLAALCLVVISTSLVSRAADNSSTPVTVPSGKPPLAIPTPPPAGTASSPIPLYLKPLADFSAAPPIPDDVMEKLHDADFLSVRDLHANLPHGELIINQGVIASFKGWDVHTAGVVIGDMDVNLTRLPKAPEAYIAFPDMVAGQNGVRFKARLSYLTASVKSAAYMVPGGAIAAMRRWKALSPDEQAQFEAIYRAAWADGWQDTAAAAAAGHPVLREPVAGEVYSAVWLENWQGAAPGVLTRVDFRVEADGKTAIAREHDSKILLMQNPAPIGS